MAILAVAHLHAFVGCAAQTRDRASPDVAAVAADAVHFVDFHLIGLAICGMTFGAGESGALQMDGVREPDVGRLLCVDEPWSLVRGLDVGIDQCGFGAAGADAFGVASGAFLHGGNPSEGAVVAKGVAFIAVRDAGFFGVGLVTELERLMLLYV